jgi:hypothetical protein
MKINKLFAIMGVGALAYLSTFNQLIPTQAALTAPASYDISMRSNGTNFSYTSANGASPTSVPLFTRTADSTYFNYSHSFSSGQHSNTSNYFLPTGLNIEMVFNRSNTSWTDATPYTGYYPTDTKIGSDNTVGSQFAKLRFRFNNQTNKNYLLTFDFSSTSGNILFRQSYNGTDLINANDNATTLWYPTGLITLFIPTYTNYVIQSYTTSGARYFDAWYLKDLGVNDAYNQGIEDGYDDAYDDGYEDGLGNNPNILLSGFQAMVGILVNFALMVLNLSVFGVSLLDIFAIMALLVGVIWILKLVRG